MVMLSQFTQFANANRVQVAFKADMTKEDIEKWSSSESSRVYTYLQDLMLDLSDIEKEKNRNCLHYIFKHDTPSIYDELQFRLDMMTSENIERLINQVDIYGMKPLDYCPSDDVRKRYVEILEKSLGKSITAASYSEAVRATYMPTSQSPSAVPVEQPQASVSQPVQPQAQPGQPSTQLAGNELPQGTIIPQGDDLEMDFGEEEPVSQQTPAETSIVQPVEDAEIVDGIQKNTSENVPKVDDSAFEFDGYKNDLSEEILGNEPKGLDDVIGHEKIKAMLRKNLIEPLKKENLDKLDNNNLTIENGFLFYGPPGCGKTFLIKALAKELGLELKELDKIEDLEKIKKDAKNKFKGSKKPTLVLIDNIDEKIDKRKTDTIADMISDCAQNGVILIAATNKYEELDNRFTGSTCFNQIIEVPLPSYEDRILIIKSVLDKCKKDMNTQISEEDIQALAKSTSGFSNEAITYVVSKGIKEELFDGNGVLDISDIKKVVEDYARARKIGKLMDDNPTSVYDTFLKRSIIEYPKDFSDVAGMNGVKEVLINSIVRRLQPETRQRFEEENMSLFNDGFLLFGPPGCGKTFIAEALAGETKLPLYKMDKSTYDDSLKGQAGKNIRKIFDQLTQKFEETGEYSILFIDEADAIFPRRGTSGGLSDEETNLMLQYLNGCTKKGIIPILATNFKDKIDTAVLRTGRIGTHIEIPAPDFEARKELFRLNTRNKQITKDITDDNLTELANMLEGYASSDISHIAKSTIDKALVDGLDTLTVEDFKQAIKTYAKQRDLSQDFGLSDKTVQYDTYKKRERIKYPKSFADVAGMETTKDTLRRTIVNKLKPEIRERFERNNMPLFNDGFMLYGKPGNGKTFIVEALAGEAGLPLYKVTKADYDTSLKGEAGNNINKIFKQLERKFEITGEYSLLFFDEADAIFPKRGTSNNFSDEETNMMLQFLNNAPARGIIPILATNYSEKIDPAVLRSGRIGTHIEIPSPDFEARKSMFEQKIKNREITKHITDDDIASIARMLNGFCAADITHLTVATIEKAINDGKEELTIEDFKEAIKNFSHERNMPEVNDLNVTSQYDTVLKRVQIKAKDPHSLDEIGGMKEAKEALFESVIMANDPEIKALNEENCIEAPNGVLLYGPPGCGKTFIMKAVAAQAKLPLYQMKMSEMGSSYINQTSNNIKAVFDQLREKFEKTGEPSILFLDECDTFFASNTGMGGNSERNQDLNTLKEEMNNAGRNGIIIVAATNEIQNINPAILRDGRFDTKIYVGLPDDEARYDIIQKDLRKRKLTAQFADDDEALKTLTEVSAGLATVSIVTAITEFIRKVIANKKAGNVEVTLGGLVEAIKQKVLKNERLQKDIAEGFLKL